MSRRPDTHIVRTRPARPGATWARWVCNCGRRSELFGFIGHAEAASRDHARATGGRTEGKGAR
jgi:hypothetical protein